LEAARPESGQGSPDLTIRIAGDRKVAVRERCNGCTNGSIIRDREGKGDILARFRDAAIVRALEDLHARFTSFATAAGGNIDYACDAK
jgi:hypothetical protein